MKVAQTGRVCSFTDLDDGAIFVAKMHDKNKVCVKAWSASRDEINKDEERKHWVIVLGPETGVRDNWPSSRSPDLFENQPVYELLDIEFFASSDLKSFTSSIGYSPVPGAIFIVGQRTYMCVFSGAPGASSFLDLESGELSDRLPDISYVMIDRWRLQRPVEREVEKILEYPCAGEQQVEPEQG